MEGLSKEQEILKILFKEFKESYNSRNLSKKINISHAGAFKLLKKLEERKIVLAKKIGKANIYSINLENNVAIKELELLLAIEAQNYQNWLEEFRELNEKSSLVILFGSIIRNEKEAKDIDLFVVSEKNKLPEIKKIIEDKNKLTAKKMHVIIQTKEDFIKDIKNKNKVSLEIIKTGIILFGNENLIKYMKEIIS